MAHANAWRRDGRPRLLNDAGKKLLDKAFSRRQQVRYGYKDFANGYLCALEGQGVLPKYLEPGVDPFDILAAKR